MAGQDITIEVTIGEMVARYTIRGCLAQPIGVEAARRLASFFIAGAIENAQEAEELLTPSDNTLEGVPCE